MLPAHVKGYDFRMGTFNTSSFRLGVFKVLKNIQDRAMVTYGSHYLPFFLPAYLFAVAMATPSEAPDFRIALACAAALAAAEPESFLLCFAANDLPVHGILASPI